MLTNEAPINKIHYIKLKGIAQRTRVGINTVKEYPYMLTMWKNSILLTPVHFQTRQMMVGIPNPMQQMMLAAVPKRWQLGLKSKGSDVSRQVVRFPIHARINTRVVIIQKGPYRSGLFFVISENLSLSGNTERISRYLISSVVTLKNY